MRAELPEGDQAGQGGDQRARAADVHAYQQSGIILRKLRQQNGRGHIADALAGNDADQQRAFFQQHRKQRAHRVQTGHIAGKDEEKNKGPTTDT